MRILEKLKTQSLRVLSYRKSTWALSDYPIRVQHNPQAAPELAWCAQILEWHAPIGFGPTRQHALGELSSNFEQICAALRADGQPQPRPGVPVPLEFSETTRMEAHYALLEEFTPAVLGMPLADLFFVSDLSSLHDFGDEADVERFLGLIRSHYGLAISPTDSLLLADILDRSQAGRDGDRAAE